MSQRIKTLDEIRDSRLLYEKKIPPFGYMIIIVVLFFIAGLGFWAYKTPKVSVIKSTGAVQSKDKNYVMATYTGEVLSTNYEEGKVVKEGDVLLTIKSVDLDLQLKQLTEQKDALSKQIDMYNKYISAIKSDRNSFDSSNKDESLFYDKYEAYKSKMEQIVVNSSLLKEYGYTDEQIETEIEAKDYQKSEIYHSELNSANSMVADINNQIILIDSQIAAVMEGKNEYEVKAPVSGKVHVVENYKTGMVIQTGVTVCSIAADKDDLEIVATVSEADAVKIKENDIVDMAISGLTQSVYGTISGKVMAKDTDVNVSNTQNGSVSFFRVVIKPDSSCVVSNTGEKISLSNGMSVEARIKYNKVTYLEYFLDFLGINLK